MRIGAHTQAETAAATKPLHLLITCLLCLGCILSFVGSVYGQPNRRGGGSAQARTASKPAQTAGRRAQVKVHGADVRDLCPGFELSFALLSTRRDEQGNAEDRAICLALLPPSAGGDPAENKMFCSYRFGGEEPKRDDPGGASNQLIRYDAGSLGEAVNGFLGSSSCSVDSKTTEKIVGVIDKVIGGGEANLKELMRNGGFTPNDILLRALDSFPAATSADQFSDQVRNKLQELKLAQKPIDASNLVAEVDRLNKDIRNKDILLNELNNQREMLKQVTSGLWFWLLVIFISLLVGISIFVYRAYSRIDENLRRQKEQFMEKEQIQAHIYSDLISHLHHNNQQPGAANQLLDTIDGFARRFEYLDRETNLSIDEEAIRGQLIGSLRDKIEKLRKIPLDESRESSEEESDVKEELSQIIESYFAHYQQLRQHKDEIRERYRNLSREFQQEISGIALRNTFPDPSANPRGGAWEAPPEVRPSLREAGGSPNPSWVQDFEKRMASLTQSIQSGFRNQEGDLRDYKELKDWIARTEKSLVNKSLLEAGESFPHWVRRLMFEQQTSLGLLPEYAPQNPASVADKVREVERRLSLASDAIALQLPRATGTIDQLVSQVMGELKQARVKAGQAEALEQERDRYREKIAILEPEVEAGRKLSEQFARYIGLRHERVFSSGQPARTLLQIIESESPEERELRHRLLAVRIAFQQAKGRPENGSRIGPMIETLQVDDWLPNLETFLAEMQDFKRDEILNKGLYMGFSKGWLHGLLRAELLMNAYFAENDAYFHLRDAVSQASAAIRAALFKHGGRVAGMKLFDPPPDGVNIERDADPQLRQFPEVEEKIVRRYKESGLPTFVIDVLTFPFSIGNQRYDVGRVVIMNPNNWLQK
jgi:hypothetical protein